MNEFEEAMNNVVSEGMRAIDRLTPEDLAKVQMILERIK